MSERRADLLPAAAGFVEKMRDWHAQGREEIELWSDACEALRELLADDELKRHAEGWPDSLTIEGKPGNLLFYEDPEYGFVLNALIKAPGINSSVHDHGESWTLYGVLEGGEEVTRFERTDGGPRVASAARIERAGSHDVTPGYIDFVPPWQIHEERNGDVRTVGFIVRSKRSGTFVQNRFDPESGAVEQYDGPVQIPYRLAW